MWTIVTYTDKQPPENRYPALIISPTRASDCCFSEMEEIGMPEANARWLFQYRRCRQCGYAVRLVLREFPDTALLASLRETLSRSFVRNVPE
jgi:hypothetical protein